MNKFNIGDQVRVVKNGGNATKFFNPEIHLDHMGVYQFNNWEELIFTVYGESKLYKGHGVTVDELCYPVSFEGKEIGYVYESRLELAQKKDGYIYTGESEQRFTNGKTYYLVPGKSINDPFAFIDNLGTEDGFFHRNHELFKPVNDIVVDPKQMQLNQKIKKAVLLLTNGTDVIRLTLDAPSSFPIMVYGTTMTMECQQGYGETYCKEVLGLEPEIINLRAK